MSQTPAIEVGGLSHAFAARDGPLAVLDSVDLRVGDGEFVSLLGPSGCGKSTLLRMLAGLIEPRSGTVMVQGETTVNRPGLAAYMPQSDLLLPWRRAMANALLGAEVAGLPRKQARAQAEALFARFGLAGFEKQWPSQLSGGMRQRLALLRTFLIPRDVLLLDEPFGALDAITRRRMYHWLEDIWREDRRSVLFVTHDVEEALVLSDRVYVMSARPGRIVRKIDVPFARPRATGEEVQSEFVALKAEVLAALDEGSPEAS